MLKAVTVLFVFVHATACAQNPIQNSSFENWEDYGSYSDPHGWQSNNYVTAGFGIIPVEEDTVAVEGDLSVKLVTKGDTSGNTVAPGILCGGTFNSSTLFCDGGFPIPKSYDFFNGYAFYTPAQDDKGGVAAFFFRWNSNKNKRDTTAVAFLPIEDTQSGFEYFSIPFSLVSLANPDSACIILASSTEAGNSPPKGSKLRVDNVEFSDATGVTEISQLQVTMFPNPANDKIVFQMPPTLETFTMNLYDAMGRKFKTSLLATNHLQINTSGFTEGIFFYDVRNEAGKARASGSFIVNH